MVQQNEDSQASQKSKFQHQSDNFAAESRFIEREVTSELEVSRGGICTQIDQTNRSILKYTSNKPRK